MDSRLGYIGSNAPKVTAYLDSVGSEYNSGYAYQVGKRPSPSMTAEAMLCRQYLGWHRNMPGMAQGLGALVKNHPLDIDQSDVYYWYYATQTLHHYGGPLWEEWNDQLKVDVPTNQVKQGIDAAVGHLVAMPGEPMPADCIPPVCQFIV